jgi:hypothetical protein
MSPRFPYQHAIVCFKLKDETKPGHRKFPVFFLVDLTQRIVFTTQVPPQDIRWQGNELLEELRKKLPLKVAEMLDAAEGGEGGSAKVDEGEEGRKGRGYPNCFGRPFDPL